MTATQLPGFTGEYTRSTTWCQPWRLRRRHDVRFHWFPSGNVMPWCQRCGLGLLYPLGDGSWGY